MFCLEMICANAQLSAVNGLAIASAAATRIGAQTVQGAIIPDSRT